MGNILRIKRDAHQGVLPLFQENYRESTRETHEGHSPGCDFLPLLSATQPQRPSPLPLKVSQTPPWLISYHQQGLHCAQRATFCVPRSIHAPEGHPSIRRVAVCLPMIETGDDHAWWMDLGLGINCRW
jgi:hypothetical protein